jgi:chromosome segregation ATPase
MGWTTALEQARAEFNQVTERMEDQRTKSEREGLRVRQIEIEALVRQLNELKREVKPYSRYAEDLEARKAEDGRLAEQIGRTQVQVMDLERRFDAPQAQISYLEEQRRQDNKRIVSMEQELPDIRRMIDQFPPRLLLLDEAIRRKQVEIEEAAKVLEAQSQVLESQRVADIRRERQFAEYAEVVEKLKVRADEVQQQVTGFIQMREEVRRVLAEVPDISARMEVRVNEIAEIQREAEDRAKRVADEFREVMLKEVRTFMVQQEEKWHSRDRRIADYEPRLVGLEDQIGIYQPQITPLYEILEAFTKSYAQAGREWLAQANKLFESAKVNLPTEVKPSRRQLRKQQAQQAAEAVPTNGAKPEPGEASGGDSELDLLDDDLIK